MLITCITSKYCH